MGWLTHLGMRCYMAGIDTLSDDLTEIIEKGEEWEKFVVERTSFEAVNPAKEVCKEGRSTLMCMILNFLLLLRCDAVILLPNWENGWARKAYRIARLLGMTIFYAIEDKDGEKRIIEEDTTWNF